jgi:hypothetical protein
MGAVTAGRQPRRVTSAPEVVLTFAETRELALPLGWFASVRHLDRSMHRIALRAQFDRQMAVIDGRSATGSSLTVPGYCKAQAHWAK